MEDKDDMVEIADVKVLKETTKSLICEVEGETIIVPKSIISEDSEVGRGEDYGVLIIPYAFADKNGLI